eukprot:CAMPEP_0179071842 /NCGR_PEP_ID=MMETSP0796-20121207/31744_1 /TAXON_ID=73915 /ORGANISM="Pyrodinium bahamense, Strain pbaha01" /LENGTH=77 /DNA_ID=CAMNT_0020768977 /DNA_START=252 /DNA_END=481 /DNA_ORIENTATION=+
MTPGKLNKCHRFVRHGTHREPWRKRKHDPRSLAACFGHGATKHRAPALQVMDSFFHHQLGRRVLDIAPLIRATVLAS